MPKDNRDVTEQGLRAFVKEANAMRRSIDPGLQTLSVKAFSEILKRWNDELTSDWKPVFQSMIKCTYDRSKSPNLCRRDTTPGASFDETSCGLSFTQKEPFVSCRTNIQKDEIRPNEKKSFSGFLKKANKLRSVYEPHLQDLTAETFSGMLNAEDKHFMAWKPIFQRMSKCKYDVRETPSKCRRYTSPGAIFDEQLCDLSVTEKDPFVACRTIISRGEILPEDVKDLAAFLEKANNNKRVARDKLKPLNQESFRKLLQLSDKKKLAQWMPIFKDVFGCKHSAGNEACTATRGSKSSTFDEDCQLNLRLRPPFGKCVLKEGARIQLADRHLMNTFLSVCGHTFSEILKANGCKTNWSSRWEKVWNADVLKKVALSAGRDFSLEAWMTDTLLSGQSDTPSERYTLQSCIASGVYGTVFHARSKRYAGGVVIKLLTVDPDDYFPPEFEVHLSKLFFEAQIGFKAMSTMKGFDSPPPTSQELRKFLLGPDFSEQPPTTLHYALGWYPIEKFDMTVGDYITKYWEDSNAMQTLADGLVYIFQRARTKGLVHGDSHWNNIGVKLVHGKVTCPSHRMRKKGKGQKAFIVDGGVLAKPTHRMRKKGMEERGQKAFAHFIDFGRSYSKEIAGKANGTLKNRSKLDKDAVTRIGHLYDSTCILGSLFRCAERSWYDIKKRKNVAILAGELIRGLGVSQLAAACLHDDSGTPAMQSFILKVHNTFNNNDLEKYISEGTEYGLTVVSWAGDLAHQMYYAVHSKILATLYRLSSPVPGPDYPRHSLKLPACPK